MHNVLAVKAERLTFLLLNGFDFQSVFPGLWLVGTTADSYRVAEAPAKVLSLMLFVLL